MSPQGAVTADLIPETLTYESARALARDKDPAVRRLLAQRTDLPPEILYYLARDRDLDVRKAVASNPVTPPRADRLLAEDAEPAVRRLLANKISPRAVGLRSDEADRRRRYIYEAVALLAQDQLARVRQVVADVLKDVADAPPEVIRRLARDDISMVAIPVLEFSPVLSDQDLLDIIRDQPFVERLSAISRRSTLDAAVSDAIIATNNTDAITHLLRNSRAQIRETTLDQLIDRAVGIPQWHEPLVYRPELPAEATVKLATFVADHLVQKLLARRELDRETAEKVARVVRQRLEEQPPHEPPSYQRSAATHAAPRPAAPDQRLPVLEKARAAQAEGVLTEAALLGALFAHDNDFVMAGLSVLSDIPFRVVLGIIRSHSPKAVAALAWKAGLTARFAQELQIKLAGIRPTDAVGPSEDGTFAMTPGAMDWQLEMFLDN